MPFNRISGTQTASYAYDSNGNMVSKGDASGTTQYVWDYENRLRQVIKPGSQTASYEYDAIGRRTKRIEGTNTTKFTYDGGDVLMDDDTTTGITKYQNLGTDNKLKLTNNGVSKYFIQDHLGSTNALTDASGAITASASYDSYGNSTNTLGTRYQFTGREKDDFSGLTYNRARWYSSELGRFISEDPLGFGGGDINTAAYTGNNPVGFTDPSGLDKGYGSYAADQWDKPINSGQEAVGFDPTIGFLGVPAPGLYQPITLFGTARWFVNLLRLGDELGCALFAEGVNDLDRLVMAGHDLQRTVDLVALMAGAAEISAAGNAGAAAGEASEASRLANLPCLHCFEADTLVQTKDGLKPIEKINTDDKVLSYNTQTGELEYQAVLQKMSRQADDIYNLRIEGENKPLAVTGEHPFYVRSAGAGDDKGEWRPTQQLHNGDEIRLADGHWAKVLSNKFRGKGQVYNFEVANNHNYFVGKERLLTHNCNSFERLTHFLDLTYEHGNKTFQRFDIEGVYYRLGSNHSAAEWFTRLESRGWTLEKFQKTLSSGITKGGYDRASNLFGTWHFLEEGSSMRILVNNTTNDIIMVGGKGLEF